jgi:hypothetical protein
MIAAGKKNRLKMKYPGERRSPASAHEPHDCWHSQLTPTLRRRTTDIRAMCRLDRGADQRQGKWMDEVTRTRAGRRRGSRAGCPYSTRTTGTCLSLRAGHPGDAFGPYRQTRPAEMRVACMADIITSRRLPAPHPPGGDHANVPAQQPAYRGSSSSQPRCLPGPVACVCGTARSRAVLTSPRSPLGMTQTVPPSTLTARMNRSR